MQSSEIVSGSRFVIAIQLSLRGGINSVFGTKRHSRHGELRSEASYLFEATRRRS
jgi:hypothetical protein